MADLSTTSPNAPGDELPSNSQNEQWEADDEEDEAVGAPLMSSSSSPAARKRRDQCESEQRRNDPFATLLVWVGALVAAVMAAFVLILIAVASKSTNGPISDDNALNAAAPDQTTRRSFVCITGQVERLELENKLGTVLAPLREAGYEPDIALVLDDSTSFSTQLKVDIEYMPPFASYGDAVEHLRQFDFRVVTDSPYLQVPDPIINQEYLHQLDHPSFTEEQRLTRARNNIRMLETWSQCYEEMVKDLKRASTYDVLVRMRDDSGFLQALDIVSVMEELASKPKSVISNGCRHRHGMNDKFAIVSKDAAQSYFEGPFRYYYTRPIDKTVVSSESFSYYTYMQEGLNVIHSPTIRHIVKLMSDENGRTVLFPKEDKSLAKQCDITVTDTHSLNACNSTWNAEQHRIETNSRVCWPYTYGGQ